MSKALTTLKIGNDMYSIRTTDHSELRLKQRNIDEYIVISNILSLGKERIQELQNQDKDIMVIDENNNVSICFCFNGNKITIITVIDKSDIFVKRNTIVENL
ncbi:MAG: hypothetical protein ACOC1K_07690 [Nanoarchaeota archaeon]